MKRLIAVAMLAGLGACQQHAPSNTEMPVPEASGNLQDAHRVPAPSADVGSAALPAPELEGVAVAAGQWRFQVSAKGDQAVFGDAGEASEFAMRCDPETRRMVFTRAASGGTGATMQIIAANGAATFYTEPGPGGRTQASNPATDTFLTDVLATAKDRIGVRIGGGPTLAMPIDPVIRQTILRCAAPIG
ncbi:hypothetical protein ACFO8O_12490 [Hephaestia sp. GCM10023244]|uniref:hypothetical protein n=1 Tax=unclassified Hephaestia TaxID=2631281 RepID=UPI002076F41D|nr:hypothetical protein [Hephaestia sp. MAHUQ-44]MCM8731779.1 hypothetical protein [Hephaestia sp. MAHUQ-44]